MLPDPAQTRTRGVRDMVRISDARMSGTSYGACILHVAPEAFIGGPLAFVRTGDMIEVDVAAAPSAPRRRRRRTGAPAQRLTQPPPRLARGYGAIFAAHVRQANEGCDFDVLDVPSTSPNPRCTNTSGLAGRTDPQPHCWPVVS